MQPAKNILTVLLLAAFSLPLMLPVFLQVKQQYVKWQMSEALEQQQLVHLKVKTSAIQWLRRGKECIINGELFDVKNTVVIKNETILTGLFDKKETEIKTTIEKQTREQQDESKWKQLVKLYTTCQASTGFITIKPPVAASNFKFRSFYTAFYLQPSLGILTPPPEIV